MKEYVRVFGLGFIVLLAGFFLASLFVKPSPPKSITIATGSVSGAYYAYAQKYKELLAEEGIELIIESTAGSIDNIQRLSRGEVDLAFVQSGTGQPYTHLSTTDGHHLVSLASVYYEPLWLFMSAEQTAFNVHDLQGKRLAVGAEGSGTRALVQLLLENNGINRSNTIFIESSSDEAAKQLLKKQVDYLFLVSSVESPLVKQLLLESSIVPFDFARAKAYTRRYRFLSAAEFPQGVMDFQRNIPSMDINLLTAAATLVTHDDIHPALSALLMQIFEKVHGEGGVLENPSQFPSQYYADFPLESSAKRYFDYGPPLLQRYLPFWVAVLVNQLKVFLIPIIALLIPLMRILPPLYRWRIRSRIYRWYSDLREIEKATHDENLTKDRRLKLIKQLDGLHQDLMGESIPLSYHDELYHLRMHIELVRNTLLSDTLDV